MVNTDPVNKVAEYKLKVSGYVSVKVPSHKFLLSTNQFTRLLTD